MMSSFHRLFRKSRRGMNVGRGSFANAVIFSVLAVTFVAC